MSDEGAAAVVGAPGNPSEPTQPVLYKYRTACQAMKMLATRTVAFTCPTTFNDPLDCQWNPVWNGYTKEFLDACSKVEAGWLINGPPEELRHLHPQKHKAILEMYAARRQASPLDGIGFQTMYGDVLRQELEAAGLRLEARIRRKAELLRVLCLSENPHSLPMWAHYAQEHAGMCVGVHWGLAAKAPTPCYLMRVQYESGPPKLVDDETLRRALLYGDMAWGRTTDFQGVVRWKHDAWRYEQEWRLVHVNAARAIDAEIAKGPKPGLAGEADLFTLPEEAFAEVLLGPKCAAADVEAVIATVRAWNVKPRVRRLSWRNGIAEYEHVKVGGVRACGAMAGGLLLSGSAGSSGPFNLPMARSAFR